MFFALGKNGLNSSTCKIRLLYLKWNFENYCQCNIIIDVKLICIFSNLFNYTCECFATWSMFFAGGNKGFNSSIYVSLVFCTT